MSEPAEPTIEVPQAEYERLTAAAQEAERLRDQYVRSLADLENSKKRLQRDREDYAKYAAETFARELLPIIDSLSQALVAVDKQSDTNAVVKGVHLIYRQLLGVLEREGVKRIPSVGEPFDPHRHEAVGQVEPTDGVNDGAIVEEVQTGYVLHGKIIRPALVKVATHSASTDQSHSTHTNEPGGSP